MSAHEQLSKYDLNMITIAAQRFAKKCPRGSFTFMDHISESTNRLWVYAEGYTNGEMQGEGFALMHTRNAPLVIATFRDAIESARAAQMRDNKSSNEGGIPVFKISPRVENPAFSEQDMASAFSQISSFSNAISHLPSPNSNLP